jgi:hypothetical protein
VIIYIHVHRIDIGHYIGKQVFERERLSMYSLYGVNIELSNKSIYIFGASEIKSTRLYLLINTSLNERVLHRDKRRAAVLCREGIDDLIGIYWPEQIDIMVKVYQIDEDNIFRLLPVIC